MITRYEKIYEDYRQADFNDRLSIYLQYPELRNDFLEIDQQEIQDRSLSSAAGPTQVRGRRLSINPFRRLLKGCQAVSG